jgi:hypothetical protein
MALTGCLRLQETLVKIGETAEADTKGHEKEKEGDNGCKTKPPIKMRERSSNAG